MAQRGPLRHRCGPDESVEREHAARRERAQRGGIDRPRWLRAALPSSGEVPQRSRACREWRCDRRPVRLHRIVQLRLVTAEGGNSTEAPRDSGMLAEERVRVVTREEGRLCERGVPPRCSEWIDPRCGELVETPRGAPVRQTCVPYQRYWLGGKGTGKGKGNQERDRTGKGRGRGRGSHVTTERGEMVAEEEGARGTERTRTAPTRRSTRSAG